MQGMWWVMVLTFVMLYSSSLVFVSLIGHGYAYSGEPPEAAQENFGTVYRAILSLFKLMNDDQGVVEPILDNTVGQILFMIFMMISNWMMLAVLTSVVSDNMISASAKCEKEEQLAEQTSKENSVRKRLSEVFLEVDKDHSGCVSEEEFMSLLNNWSTCHQLCDASGLNVDDLKEFFVSVSTISPGEGRVMLYDEFIGHLKDGNKVCTERSVLRMMDYMRCMEHRMNAKLNRALSKLGVDPETLDNDGFS